MANMRVYDLAKKLGKSNKDVIAALEKIGVKEKKHSSSLDEETAAKVQKALKPPTARKKTKGVAAKPAAEKKAEKKKAVPKAKPKPAGKEGKKPKEARRSGPSPVGENFLRKSRRQKKSHRWPNSPSPGNPRRVRLRLPKNLKRP
jgi:translation initiation factor IF-2